MSYRRYSIPIQPAPNSAPHPNRFRVRVRKLKLAELLLREAVHYRMDLPVVLSRPCVYGVFSGPVGGFLPREHLCVGCLRCTVEFPNVVRILPNPERLGLGDSYLDPDTVDTLLYEAASGRVPVRGAGYAGAFGGDGWDAMWTDMSEIVRPTRDGIHGREYISTEVFLGSRPRLLQFDASGRSVGERPHGISLPIPMLFDLPPRLARSEQALTALVAATEMLETLVVLPLELVRDRGLQSAAIVPLVEPARAREMITLAWRPRMLELDGWDLAAFRALVDGLPDTLIGVRLPFGEDLLPLIEQGASAFHLTADYHGRTSTGFVLEAIRSTHSSLVHQGRREQVTLLGSGGIVAAEHVPKAILCGLDAVGLDLSPLIALQARLLGEALNPEQAPLELPAFEAGWGKQRLVNLIASWRDQLLEILGAMGLREVRRLRGELGRAMFQPELEREAFASIPGFGELHD